MITRNVVATAFLVALTSCYTQLYQFEPCFRDSQCHRLQECKKWDGFEQGQCWLRCETDKDCPGGPKTICVELDDGERVCNMETPQM